jgi:hypothetical protein
MGITKLGKLQQGQPLAQEFGIYGFTGGLNVKTVPQQLGDSDLAVAQDGYLTSEGGFQLRNGMTRYGTALPTAGPVYLARFWQDVINGSPQATELVYLLAQNGTGLYSVGANRNTLIGTIGNSGVGMQYARIQNPSPLHFPNALTDCFVVCSGVGGPYVWDGTNFYTPTGWSAASGASWCAQVNGILWFGGIPGTPNQIFGTGDGVLEPMESLPGFRNFVYSSRVMGLVASGTGAQAALCVGLNDGVAILYGTGPSNFYQMETPFADAVTAGNTMISYDGTIFFLGHSADYAFSLGNVPTQFSQKVEPWILNRPYSSSPANPGYPLTTNRAASWQTVYNNRLHLGYCSQLSTPDTVLVYDLDVNAWTVLRPTPGLASMILLNAPSDPDPYTALVGGTNGLIYTWDVQPAEGASVYDDTAPVLAALQTKYYKIGVPGTNKAMFRFYPEFFLSGTFVGDFLLSLDYGGAQVTTPLSLAYVPFYGVWDVSTWDDADWGTGAQAEFVPFTAPTTRVDYPASQGESFSFGIQMTQALAPWIFAGGSGVVQQRGRT